MIRGGLAMGKTAVALDLTAIERRELESLASRRKTAQGLAQRARIVLLAAEGGENKDISVRLGAAPNTVGKWRRRFAQFRMDGLYDEPRPGAPRQIGDDDVAEVIRQTIETTPRRDALEPALDGQGRRLRALDDSSDLESLQPAASSHGNVQALCRPAVCRESARHCRALSVAAGARGGSLRRRREPDSSARSNPPAFAHAPGPSRAAYARRHPPRNPQPVRRARRCRRHGHRALLSRGREFLRFLREIERNVPPDLDGYC
jgi:transposase-like protein